MLMPVLTTMLLMSAPAAFAAASPTPASGQEQLGEWNVAGSDLGCAIHAAGGNGTVLSVIGFPGEDKLAFLIQNQRWTSLANGQRYALTVEFDEKGQWPVEAVAQREIDADGPGLLFAVQPGENARGESFMAEFAEARLMHIRRDGSSVGTIVLSESGTATRALAHCLASLWTGGHTGMGGPLEEIDPAYEASGEKPVEI